MREIAILIPAAGASSRMRGRDKLLEEIDSQPLLSRQAQKAMASGAPVLVTVRPGDARLGVLPTGVDHREVPQASEGLSASLRVAAAWAQAHSAGALMVMLADLPDLTTDDLETIAAAYAQDPSRIIRATDDSGKPGHPVIFPAAFFDAIQKLTGDDGAKSLLAQHPPRFCRLPGLRATTDLDTPEDWAAWRAKHARK